MSDQELAKDRVGTPANRSPTTTETDPALFSLSRWFGTVGLIAILLLAVICALLLSRLFAERMLLQEGRLTMQFVQGIIDVEDASSYFESATADHSSYMEDLLAHIAGSPDVLRTNLYSRERRIIWSSDRSMINRSFADASNPELDAALSGKLEIHQEEVGQSDHEKLEHSDLRTSDDYFIELYVPIQDRARKSVVGAVELYRAPGLLRETIASGMRIIWIGAIGAGVLLYLALLPLVRRAESMIRTQQDRIVEAETVAAVGDLGSAVAHGIRNPLAVIRTSAEIVRDGNDVGVVREAASDIMDQVDRLEHWVRELLTYVHLPTGNSESIDIEPLVRNSLTQFSAEMRRRGIIAGVELAESLPPVRGDTILVAQVLNSLIANSVEAMQHGGMVRLGARGGTPGFVVLTVRDTGIGMKDEQLKRVFKPFQTTKPRGLGVGLPLAKRIVERMRGRIVIFSKPGVGTTVELTLPTANR